MENVICFLIWSIMVIIILRFTPNDKIEAIGNFFEKVLPGAPWRNKGK